jgi:hypothetical protein
VLLAGGVADCGSGCALWLAAVWSLMLLLSAEVEAEGEVVDAGAFEVAALLLAALVSLLVDGAAVLLDEVAAVVPVLPIDEVGPGLLAPQ